MRTASSLNFAASYRKPMRLLAATLLVAVAASVSQTAFSQPHAGRHGGDMMAPRMVERMLDTVAATPEQRTQIEQILRSARADMRTQRDAGRQMREQAMALFTQPTVDARAAETLRQQMLSQHDQATRRGLQTMLEVSRVLTPEQRRLVADKMAQRKAEMERHRAERGNADKAR